MDLLEEKESILLKNKHHILRMSGSKAKANIIGAYLALLEYYQTVSGQKVIDEKFDIDPEFLEKFDYYLFSGTEKSLKELENNAEELYEIFKKIIDTYRENEFCTYQYISHLKVNKFEMEMALWNFFNFLGEDVANIYYDMIDSGNICYLSKKMDRLGCAFNSRPIDNDCVIVQYVPDYFDFYSTLAHEIGHCYQFYLQRNQQSYSSIDQYSEITSILFEKLFVEYAKRNHMLKEEQVINLENHIIFLNNVSVSKAICKLLKDDQISIVNPYNLDYKCKIDKEKIKEEIINDCGYVKPIDPSPSFLEIRYAIGTIIANHFFEKMQEDFEKGWKEYKDFICTINCLPMKDVIEEYFDIPLIQNNIKKLTKSYRER